MRELRLSDFRVGTSRLYKHAGGVFHARFKIRGKEYRLSTGQTQEKPAAVAALQLYRDRLSGPPKQAKIGGQAWSIAAICELYTAEMPRVGKVSLSTAKSNVNCLLRLLDRAGRDGRAVLGVLTRELTFKARTTAYAARGLSYGKDSDFRLNYSLNSVERQAKAVFSRRALDFYAERGIGIPDSIRAWKDIPLLPQFKTAFRPIDAEADAAMQRLAGAVLGDKGRLSKEDKTRLPGVDVAIAFELARFCGLTAKEIYFAQWDWVRPQPDGGQAVDIRRRDANPEMGLPEFVTKGNAKERCVPVAPWRVLRWQRASGRADGALVGAGTPTDRQNVIAREACAWVANWMPADRTKRLHELRKMAGSDVLTRTGSIKRAADFLGDSVATTEKHYAAFLKPTAAL